MLASRSGMDYSPGMQFQTSLINKEEAKALTMRNQPENEQQKRFWCGSIKHLRYSSEDTPVGLVIRKAKKLALGLGISQCEANKSVEDETVE